MHILREIEIKDEKVQGLYCDSLTPDILSRIATKESQMRELYSNSSSSASSSSTSDSSLAKADKLASRIASDYTRAEEWSTQKKELSHKLWRKVYAHHRRLLKDIELIDDDLVASVASSIPKAATLAERSQLPLLLVNAGVGDTDNDAGDPKTRKKRSIGGSVSDAKHHGHKSGSSARGTPNLDDPKYLEKDSYGAGDGEDERDENLYCFCQRGSFGEMIGCDSDDCKYEWFHIGCVGVSKPLPQTWVCSDCLAKKKRRRA